MIKNKVEICGVNTAKLKVLSEAEKEALFARLDSGDKSAREALILGNLRLVLSVIQRFANRNENIDDLFQIGCVGLMKAIDNFDTSLNVRFSTYAVPMIIGEIRRYLRDNNMIRVSRSMRDLAYKTLQLREQLLSEKQREPKVEELAVLLEVTPEEITRALEAITEPVSLYEPIYHENGDALYIMDQLGDSRDTVDMWVENLAVKEAMAHLSEREKKVLTLRFFNGRTQMEVSRDIGISQAQVSRMEKAALLRLRKYM
ncbi:MAG: RNA polymerase sporulation sigma factor SigG [Clostridia bacterium]|nr:RNA polymerase sporulation sigma factor SigG [Clostridia bacterium]